MGMTAIRKVVTTVSIMAVLAMISLGMAQHWFYAAPTPETPSAPATVQAKPSASPAFSFTLLEKPGPLPELRFVDGDGRALTIADFRGKLVLLNIWATWCVPCRSEMPTLDRLQAKLGGSDFEVLALSIDRAGIAAVKAFYEELGLAALRIYVGDSTDIMRGLGIAGIPVTLFIDREGRETGRLAGPAEWDSPEVLSFLRAQLAKAKRTQTSEATRFMDDQSQKDDK